MAHSFNNDLLLSEADLKRAQADFPNVFFALDHPELKARFLPIDRRANAAKARSRQWGFSAVVLATLALMIAAAEVLLHGQSKSVVRLFAGLGAAAGILSVVIGVFGVMFRERKMRWLADRLSTERLRQFHFQHYIAFADAILDGAESPETAAEYLRQRATRYARFDEDFIGHADEHIHEIVETEDPGEGLLFPEREKSVAKTEPFLSEYLRAYTVLRFERQIGYCDLMLREKGAVWKYAPVRQAKLIGAIAAACVFAILALHGLVLVGAFADIEWMKGPAIHVAAIWSAIVALAARTLEEGFQPETEVERLRQYRLSLKRVYERFKTSEDVDDKLKAMMDCEKLAFSEMVLFLRGNYEAQYVM